MLLLNKNNVVYSRGQRLDWGSDPLGRVDKYAKIFSDERFIGGIYWFKTVVSSSSPGMVGNQCWRQSAWRIVKFTRVPKIKSEIIKRKNRSDFLSPFLSHWFYRFGSVINIHLKWITYYADSRFTRSSLVAVSIHLMELSRFALIYIELISINPRTGRVIVELNTNKSFTLSLWLLLYSFLYPSVDKNVFFDLLDRN